MNNPNHIKFVSKLNHYRITLRQGIPGNPIMAIPPKPGLYALFTDGQLFTEDPEVIEMLKKNPQHGHTYFAIEEEATDPFQKNRKSSEPAHSIMEMGHGEKTGRIVSVPLPPNPAVKEMAENMLKALMPSIVEKVRAQILAENGKDVPVTASAQTTTEEAPAVKVKKAKKEVVTQEATEPEPAK